ncbi:TraB/GumN family protein [Rubrivirga litoralis]|uniref:TraB/GumN family protein n=1 Tax=Rubrivirga litoralis TaxID=3075598 RepID=A0ABU3BMW2_9BACT|nr:TraB/GumN family protein [Rubrivirga sp. F394]MDT0630598.1 TraB/GumN family protein [Rubrivirga sp. F394]
MRLALAAFLALTLALPALAQSDEEPDDRRPPMFVLEDGDSRVVLLGSVHFLPADALPLPAHVEAAYDAADVVAFELDLDLAQAGAQGMMVAGMDEETVAEALTAEQKAAFDDAVAPLGVPAGAFDAFEPWLAGLTYSALMAQRAGATPGGGVDAHLFARAKADDKERVPFETIALQTAAFDDLPTDVQVAFLMDSIEDADTDPSEMFDDMVDAWSTGDDEALVTLINEGMTQPEVFEALLVTRNRAWVPQVLSLLARDHDALVVVGAGHLVGPQSVVEMLREDGYTVERM